MKLTPPQAALLRRIHVVKTTLDVRHFRHLAGERVTADKLVALGLLTKRVRWPYQVTAYDFTDEGRKVLALLGVA